MAWRQAVISIDRIKVALDCVARPAEDGDRVSVLVPFKVSADPAPFRAGAFASLDLGGGSATYRILSAVDRGQRGEEFDLELEPVDGPVPAEDLAGATDDEDPPADLPEPADPLEDLVDVIAALDSEDPAHYTEGGKPDARVLSDLVNRRVSAAERDAAFARFKARGGDE